MNKTIKLTIGEFSRLCFVTVDHNDHHEPGHIDLEYCEIVDSHNDEPSLLVTFRPIAVVETAVCIDHRGSYDTFDETLTQALHYIEEHGYTVAQRARFCYIHGIWDCDNTTDWLTEIQIPVIKP